MEHDHIPADGPPPVEISELDKKRLGEVSLVRLESLAKSLRAVSEVSDI